MQRMKMNDTVKIKALDALVKKLEAMTADDGAAFLSLVMETLKKNRPINESYPLQGEDVTVYSAAEKMYQTYSYINYTKEQNKKGLWPNVQKRAIASVKRFATYEAAGNPIQIGRWVKGVFAFLYLGNPEKGIVVPDPETYLEIIPGKDYSAISPAEMKQALPGESPNLILPVVKEQGTNLTNQELEAAKDCLSEKMEALKSEMDDVKGAKTEELAKMQAEIAAMQASLEAKQQALMAEMEAKKAEMEARMELLKNQIYLLDSQIYSILCYNGETVSFTKITSGKPAPVTEPVIIFQKLRFLDEELGKLASLYTIRWQDLDMFEDLLKYNPIARDTFAPHERCVQLVRLSRTGTLTGKFERDDGLPSNMLVDYEYYHGKTVGIIIRNGENIYLGWTDESRVHIKDDLVVDFSKTTIIEEPTKREKSPYWSKFDEENEQKRQKRELKEFIDGYISRSFIFNILQGVVDRTDMLPLPKGECLGKQSQYVVYSMADGALTDNRFGTFADIVKKCNVKRMFQVGDMLLTTQHLSPEYYSHGARYETWNNPRGRGDANRTHDVAVDDCTLYPINVIDVDEPVKHLHYTDGSNTPCYVNLDSVLLETERECRIHAGDRKINGKPADKEEIKKFGVQVADIDGTMRTVLPVREKDREFSITQDTPAIHVFVSVEKSDDYYWRGSGEKKARANFELYSDEYINLTFMNSVWLEYVISSQKLGGWMVGGKTVEYAYVIRYLKTALDYVRKREEQEKALIDAVDPEICKDANWPHLLSEWKLEKNVHSITEYQAKRFVKAMQAERKV